MAHNSGSLKLKVKLFRGPSFLCRVYESEAPCLQFWLKYTYCGIKLLRVEFIVLLSRLSDVWL